MYGSKRAFPRARWVFAGCAAVGHTGSMKCVNLFGRLSQKSKRRTISRSGRLPIDRLGNGERTLRAAIKVTRAVVQRSRWDTQSTQHGVIKIFGCLEVVGTEHDVAEHGFPLDKYSCNARPNTRILSASPLPMNAASARACGTTLGTQRGTRLAALCCGYPKFSPCLQR